MFPRGPGTAGHVPSCGPRAGVPSRICGKRADIRTNFRVQRESGRTRDSCCLLPGGEVPPWATTGLQTVVRSGHRTTRSQLKDDSVQLTLTDASLKKGTRPAGRHRRPGAEHHRAPACRGESVRPLVPRGQQRRSRASRTTDPARRPSSSSSGGPRPSPCSRAARPSSCSARRAPPSPSETARFAEFPIEKTDKIFTVLSEFGTSGSGKLGTTPGPLHNEIPEPDRSVDNSTYWQADFSKAHYDEMFNGDGRVVQGLLPRAVLGPLHRDQHRERLGEGPRQRLVVRRQRRRGQRRLVGVRRRLRRRVVRAAGRGRQDRRRRSTPTWRSSTRGTATTSTATATSTSPTATSTTSRPCTPARARRPAPTRTPSGRTAGTSTTGVRHHRPDRRRQGQQGRRRPDR